MLFQLNNFAECEDIEYICGLISEILKIPVYFLDKNGGILFEHTYGYIHNPLYSNKKELLSQLIHHDHADNFPILTTTKYLENFFSIQVRKENIYLGTIIVGPSITSEINEETINALITDYKVPQKYRRELFNYYKCIPMINYKKLVNISMLLYYILYNIKLDMSAVIEKNNSLRNIDIKIENDIDFSLSKNRQYSFFHHTPEYEKFIILYIKEGEKEKLIEHLSKPSDGEAGILAKNNPLRSQKNLFICSATIAARAAIEGGLSSELAFTISDSYIQHVEELNDIKEVMNLHFKMLCDFTDRVRMVKKHNYSKTIIKCRNYIFKHLYEDISLSQLAEITGLSCNYLSELFKKEVGIPLSEYIQKERIEEAKKLLALSNDSIMDICISLNFTDQSYFTKIFKKFTGLTPKQYRDKL